VTPDPAGLNLSAAAAILRRAMRDKTYRATPLGQLVGRYYPLAP
jgi:hypothetical protein